MELKENGENEKIAPILNYYFTSSQDSLAIIFKIINEFKSEGCVYQEILTKFKKKQKNANLFLISHYIRKLLKMGLVSLHTRKKGSNFVKLVKSKFYKKKKFEFKNHQTVEIKKRPFTSFKASSPPKLVKSLKELNDYRRGLSYEENVIKGFFQEPKKGLLMRDLYDHLVSQTRRKSLNRTIDRLISCKVLRRKALRNGKNYFFEYFAQNVPSLCDDLFAQKHEEEVEDNGVSLDDVPLETDNFKNNENHIFLNDKVLNELCSILIKHFSNKNKKKIFLFKEILWFNKNKVWNQEELFEKLKESRSTRGRRDEDLMLAKILSEYDESNGKVLKRKSKRRITEFRVTRVKQILNYVYKNDAILSLTDIRKEFLTQYEKGFHFKIDKKTVRNLLKQLQYVNLLRTKKIKVSIENKDKDLNQVQIKWFVTNNNYIVEWDDIDLEELIGIKQENSFKGT
jgi:hypothetical protein